MRLKEDEHSWRAGGVKRRDFRHDFGTPEVPKGHPKRRHKEKKRKVAKHTHVWIERDLYSGEYWKERGLPEPPRSAVVYVCNIPGCEKRRYVKNPRYAYEYYKWQKNNGLWHRVFRRKRARLVE